MPHSSDDPSDAARGETIPIGIMRAHHSRMGLLIVQQRRHGSADALTIRADQNGRPRLDALGTLRRLTHYEHRLAEAGRLLLHPAAICEHKMRGIQKCHECRIIKRVNKMDIVRMGKQSAHRTTHVRIWVDGKNDIHVASPGNIQNRAANGCHAIAEILAPMTGDRDDLPSLASV